MTERPFTEFARLNPGHFLVEAKHDGERVLVTVTDETVVVENRYGTTYDFAFLPDYMAEVRYAVSNLEKPLVLDAEFVSLSGDLYSFLKDRVNAIENLQLIVFDLLQHGGVDLRAYSLLSRKKALGLLQETRRVRHVGFKLVTSEDEVWDYYYSMVKAGFEGIVVKPVESIYTDGAWCKLKKNITHDVVILAIKKTAAYLLRQEARSFLIGFVDDEGKTVPYGDVSSGWQHVDPAQFIYRKDGAGKTLEDKNYVYLEPSIVVEVMAHSLLETRKFREPRVLRLRLDKRPEECKPPDGH